MENVKRPVLIIETGGTFGKTKGINGWFNEYNDSAAVRDIVERCFLKVKIRSIIHKDSLHMNDADRDMIVEHIQENPDHDIIIVHGTDTMIRTAEYINQNVKDVDSKKIILTGAMVPYAHTKTEATGNLLMCYGYITTTVDTGIKIGMHGLIAPYDKIYKNIHLGKFDLNDSE